MYGYKHLLMRKALNVIKQYACDKAPGPDGYTMVFLQKSLFKIRDVMRTIDYFHHQERFGKEFQCYLHCLIPKKKGARELKDFRPIGLIEIFYKLIAKLLTERLRRVGPKLISNSQMAFLKGRQIMDAALIANERIDSRQREKNTGIMSKLDIEKAYDPVNWGFLLDILTDMRFDRRWQNGFGSTSSQSDSQFSLMALHRVYLLARTKMGIWYCISTVRSSVLINGSP